MKFHFGNILSVAIKHVYHRGGTFYYQRRIPTDLRVRYGGQSNIKLNLETSDLKMVAKRVDGLNRHYESTWEAMRADDSITPLTVREAATALLKQYDLAPLPAKNTPDNLERFFDLVVEPKREAAARGDEEEYRNASPSDYLKQHEAEAWKLLTHPPKLMLSDALEIYLQGHQKANQPAFVTYSRRAWKKLTEALGDKPFLEVNREDANTFVSRILADGAKSTTARRLVNSVKAVFSTVIQEKELSKANPFAKIRIAGLGDDSIAREPFTPEELKRLGELCKVKDDDMRWLLALQMDTGARLAEIAGIALADIHLDGETPFLAIRKHKWRGLKNENSVRDVPLVGHSLWAAQRIIAQATSGQLYGFPRYTNEVTCNATGAANALNAWVAAQGIAKTTHSFRHSMRDRLRNVNAPKDIQEAIGGWGQNTIGDNYGQGYARKVMAEWLSKAVAV